MVISNSQSVSICFRLKGKFATKDSENLHEILSLKHNFQKKKISEFLSLWIQNLCENSTFKVIPARGIFKRINRIQRLHNKLTLESSYPKLVLILILLHWHSLITAFLLQVDCSNIAGRWFVTPLPPSYIAYPPFFFPILSNPPPLPLPHQSPPLTALFAALFLWLNGWSCHIWQIFPNSIKGEGGKRQGVILTIWTFFKAKNNILWSLNID